MTQIKCDSKITSLAFLMFDLCGHIYLIKDSSNGYFTGSPSSNKRMETISIIDPTMAFRLKNVCAIVSGKRLVRVTKHQLRLLYYISRRETIYACSMDLPRDSVRGTCSLSDGSSISTTTRTLQCTYFTGHFRPPAKWE